MSGGHKYCPEEIADIPNAPQFETWSYNQVFRAKRLPEATYVFSDFDRLNFWQVELAAKVAGRLRAAGVRVLNDPSRVLQRLPLLKRLHASGYNQFQVWDAAADGLPDRYPVFLRTRCAHRGVLTDLLQNQEEASEALEKLLASGHVLNDLIFVEYCAEPLDGGIFRKLAVFRVGDEMLTTMAVHERHWQAKYGEEGVANEALYQEEFEFVQTNRYAAEIKAAFEIASIDYGRADFAIVGSRPQIYEINTNPDISRIEEHPFDIRVQADALFHGRLANALLALDTPRKRGAYIDMNHPDLVEQRRKDRLVIHERWAP